MAKSSYSEIISENRVASMELRRTIFCKYAVHSGNQHNMLKLMDDSQAQALRLALRLCDNF